MLREALVADFTPAFSRSVAFEDAVLECVPGDKGGRSYTGISEVAHPTWEGWAIIDGYITEGLAGTSLNTALLADRSLQSSVRILYYLSYWLPINGAHLIDQGIANKLYDMAVNMGPAKAITWLQRGLNIRGWDAGGDIPLPDMPVDGIMNATTVARANAAPAVRLLCMLQAASSKHYWDICEAEPSQRKFADGWLARAAE
jgi:lysozyme family protein